jgi:membrane protease YdiL (CAAX protease family)
MTESTHFSKSSQPLWQMIAITVAVELGIIALTFMLSDSQAGAELKNTMQAVKQKMGLPFLAVVVCLAAPVGEELIFRLALPAVLEKVTKSRALAVGISSGLWGVGHAGRPINAALISLSGVNYSLLRYRSGSLWPTIGLHIVNNTLAFTALVLGGVL